MKKILSLILALCMCLFGVLVFTACDESNEVGSASESPSGTNEETVGLSEETVGLSEETWKAALAQQNFDNVTVHYSFVADTATQNHVVKIANDEVYREISMTTDGTEIMNTDFHFTGEEGIMQRDMFLAIFLALLADMDNYTYDSESGAYVSKNEVNTTIPMDDEKNIYVEEFMTNGKAKFSENGALLEFVCTLKESAYMDNALQNVTEGEVVWTFSDYGTTVIEASAE